MVACLGVLYCWVRGGAGGVWAGLAVRDARGYYFERPVVACLGVLYCCVRGGAGGVWVGLAVRLLLGAREATTWSPTHAVVLDEEYLKYEINL